MGSDCFHHFPHLNTGSFPLLTQSLFLELPLSLRVCTRVDMFSKIVERKEGHPALSVQVQVMDALCSASTVWCTQSWIQTLGVACPCPPSPTLCCGQAVPALPKAFFSPSLLIMVFCKCLVVFLFLNQVFFFFFMFFPFAPEFDIKFLYSCIRSWVLCTQITSSPFSVT